jgi:hypothetical protein
MILDFLDVVMDMYCEPMPYMCGSNAQFAAFFIDQSLGNHITSSLALYSLLGEIFLTTQRLFLIREVKILKNVTVRTVGPILSSISFVFYLPYWFAYDFVTTGNVYVFKNQTYVERSLALNDFGNSMTGKWLLSTLSIFRILLVIVVLFAVNVVSVFSFRNYFSKKARLSTRRGL